MFTVIIIMSVGMVVGFFLREKETLLNRIDRLVMPAICLLLFLLGLSIGGSEAITSRLGSLGVTALLLTLAGLMGTMVVSKTVYVRWFRGRHEK